MSYEIEKGVELTPRRSKYPFSDMEVGDSFLVDESGNHAAARNAATGYGQRHDMKFSSRTTVAGLRIWRVA